MRRIPEWLLAVVICLSAGALPVQGAHPVLQAIDDAQTAGEISEGEATLYRVMLATGNGEGIPAQLRVGQGEPMRCATQIIQGARRNMGDYPADIQTQLDKMLSRPSLPEYIDTDHYRIHYATSGSNVIWGWPDPTYRDGVAIACEESWEEYHTGVNQDWDLVPSDGGAGGGSGLIDCYVVNLGSGLYGYAEAESSVPGDPPWDFTGFFVIDNDYTGFGYPDRLDPARVTIAHEYHHVIQFGYNVNGGGGYWMEQTSTWEEDEVYDDINDNYAYLSCFFSIPYKKLSWTNGCHEYGAFVWPRYLMEYYDINGLMPTPGHDLIQEIWQGVKWVGGTGLDRMDDALENHGSSLDLAFAEFGRWNFYTQVRHDGNHYEEGNFYNGVAFDHVYSNYPWVDQHPTANKRPDRLGTSYMKFNRDDGSNHNTLVVTFDGPTTTNAVTVLVKENGGNVFHEYYMELDENKDGVLSIPAWDGMDYAYMAVSIRNISQDAQDYAFDVETQIGSSSVDDPGRIVVMTDNRPNPFYPATTIRYNLSESAPVTVRVVDASGRIIRTLVDEDQPTGVHEVKWFADDDSGRRVSAGVYFYQVLAGPQTQSKKMILLP